MTVQRLTVIAPSATIGRKQQGGHVSGSGKDDPKRQDDEWPRPVPPYTPQYTVSEEVASQHDSEQRSESVADDRDLQGDASEQEEGGSGHD